MTKRPKQAKTNGAAPSNNSKGGEVEALRGQLEKAQMELAAIHTRLRNDAGPIGVQIAIDRLSGRFGLEVIINPQDPEPDLAILADAMTKALGQVQAHRIKLAEVRAGQSSGPPSGQPGGPG